MINYGLKKFYSTGPCSKFLEGMEINILLKLLSIVKGSFALVKAPAVVALAPWAERPEIRLSLIYKVNALPFSILVVD